MLSNNVILIRLAFAALLGACIGLERDIHRRPAGIRTSMFVCMATALFTMVSVQISHFYGDTSSTRIASNIVQGVGFLGAGAILKDNAGLVGMTTAATIFIEAAIGMAAGGGLYLVAGSATGLVLFGLVVLAGFADRLGLKAHVLLFRFTTTHPDNVSGEVQRLLASMKVAAQHLRVTMSGATSVVEVQAEVSHNEQQQIVEKFSREGVVTEVVSLEGRHE